MVENIGLFLRENRLKKEMSIQDLSQLTKINEKKINYFENNIKIPSDKEIERLSGALEFDKNDLIILKKVLEKKDDLFFKKISQIIILTFISILISIFYSFIKFPSIIEYFTANSSNTLGYLSIHWHHFAMIAISFLFLVLGTILFLVDFSRYINKRKGITVLLICLIIGIIFILLNIVINLDFYKYSWNEFYN